MIGTIAIDRNFAGSFWSYYSLGDGIAGMTAALEMTRLGYSWTILEARASAGGRVRTIRAGDVVNETDPSVLLGADNNIFFAGVHLSLLQGWQEGAILSAYSAIDGVVDRDVNA